MTLLTLLDIDLCFHFPQEVCHAALFKVKKQCVCWQSRPISTPSVSARVFQRRTPLEWARLHGKPLWVFWTMLVCLHLGEVLCLFGVQLQARSLCVTVAVNSHSSSSARAWCQNLCQKLITTDYYFKIFLVYLSYTHALIKCLHRANSSPSWICGHLIRHQA